jgi:hypothetical protein
MFCNMMLILKKKEYNRKFILNIQKNLNRLYESIDMHSPLLNCYIFICKLIICISIFLSLNSHHWIRDIDGSKHIGGKKIFFLFNKNI